MAMESARGEGMFRIHDALTALAEDPTRLERDRGRFNKSPPTWLYRSRSEMPGATTLPPSPGPADRAQLRCDDRKWQIKMEQLASVPSFQLNDQIREEKRWVFKEFYPPGPGTLPAPDGWFTDRRIIQAATDRVRKWWKEQGLWNDQLPNKDWLLGHVWKHETPLEPESEWEPNPDYVPPLRGLFASSSPTPTLPKQRRKNEDELRRIAERKPVREHQHQASRPIHQFLFQVGIARERIQEDLRRQARGVVGANGRGDDPGDGQQSGRGDMADASDRDAEGDANPNEYALDINTQAYEYVKDLWVGRGIWDRKWGVLPGMTWKHERPLEDLLAQDPEYVRLQKAALESRRQTAELWARQKAAAESTARPLLAAPRNIFAPESQSNDDAAPALPPRSDKSLNGGQGSSPATMPEATAAPAAEVEANVDVLNAPRRARGSSPTNPPAGAAVAG